MLCLNHNKENPLFKAQNVYNVWQKIREKNLEKILLVQTLVKELTLGDEWFTIFYPSISRL